MDNTQIPGHPIIALILAFVSLISGVYASLISNVEVIVRLGAGAIAMASGTMAFCYYYYAWKEKKLIVKQLQNK